MLGFYFSIDTVENDNFEKSKSVLIRQYVWVITVNRQAWQRKTMNVDVNRGSRLVFFFVSQTPKDI